MKKIKGIIKKICLCMVALSCLFLASANLVVQEEKAIAKSENTKNEKYFLNFSSSNEELDRFTNDIFKRYTAYSDESGDYRVNSQTLGVGLETYNRGWSANSLYWFNSSGQSGFGTNKIESIREYLDTIPVDEYGYVWQYPDVVRGTTEGLTEGYHSMGWPFPTSSNSNGNTKTWEFNGSSKENWVTNMPSPVVENGLFKGSISGTNVVNWDLGASISPYIKSTKHSPWLEIDIRMSYLSYYENIDDIYVYFTNSYSEDFSDAKKVSLRQYGALNYSYLSGNYEHILYFPMYLNEYWGTNKAIYKLRIVIAGKRDKTFSGTFALNYVRPSYDTRHTNNNCIYINTVKTDYENTGDLEYLKGKITSLRKVMTFLMQTYDENRRLIDQSYLVGHEGDNDQIETSLGNGYYDILFMSKFDFHSNMYFYSALKDMAYLENVLSKNGISVSKSLATVKTGAQSGLSSASYNYTASQLLSIAEDVKTALQQTCNDTQKTGFWDSAKGRFISGYDSDGKKLDYGFTMWNSEAITLGIATPSQAEQIISWIDGSRIVSGDDSTGADIYRYQFAPRINTVKNDGDLFYYGYKPKPAYGTEQIQNGGATLYTSYYDILSRLAVSGADDAFERFSAIGDWYIEVLDYWNANKSNYDSNLQFFRAYYENKNIPMQGYGTEGVVGLDFEFIESALINAVIPRGFFGISSEDGKELTVNPAKPSSLDFWKIENLYFNDVFYDLTIKDNSVKINSVRGETANLSLKVKLDEPNGDYDVVYNGNVIDDYYLSDGKIIVELPFAEGIVEIVSTEFAVQEANVYGYNDLFPSNNFAGQTSEHNGYVKTSSDTDESQTVTFMANFDQSSLTDTSIILRTKGNDAKSGVKFTFSSGKGSVTGIGKERNFDVSLLDGQIRKLTFGAVDCAERDYVKVFFEVDGARVLEFFENKNKAVFGGSETGVIFQNVPSSVMFMHGEKYGIESINGNFTEITQETQRLYTIGKDYGKYKVLSFKISKNPNSQDYVGRGVAINFNHPDHIYYGLRLQTGYYGGNGYYMLVDRYADNAQFTSTTLPNAGYDTGDGLIEIGVFDLGENVRCIIFINKTKKYDEIFAKPTYFGNSITFNASSSSIYKSTAYKFEVTKEPTCMADGEGRIIDVATGSIVKTNLVIDAKAHLFGDDDRCIYCGKLKQVTLTKIVDGEQSFVEVSKGEKISLSAVEKQNKVHIGWDIGGILYPTDYSFNLGDDLVTTAVFINFTTDEKAGIRTSDPQGLRFMARISNESLELLESYGLSAKFGTRISCKEMSGYLDVDTAVWYNRNDVIEGTSYSVYTAVIIDFYDERYFIYNFTAKGWMEITYASGESVRIYSTCNEFYRSICMVAKLALDDCKDQKSGDYTTYFNGKYYLSTMTTDCLQYLVEVAQKDVDFDKDDDYGHFDDWIN